MTSDRNSNQKTDVQISGALPQSTDAVFDVLDFTFQPIVDIGTGVVYGYETRPQSLNEHGPRSAMATTGSTQACDGLTGSEIQQFEKALNRFGKLRIAQGTKLFFKPDGNELSRNGDVHTQMATLVRDAGLQNNQICIEFSERHHMTVPDATHQAINNLRQMGFLVALDNFGRGACELGLLHDLSPDYVKIDDFFLEGVDSDPRRKLFVTTVANLAHVLGARVIAQGVATERAFKVCRDVGCDLVQGQYIAPSFRKPAAAKLFYDHIRDSAAGPQRRREQDRIRNELVQLPTISFNASMNDLLDMVVHNQNGSVIPVVDANMEPRGLIHERNLKAYLYSGGQDEADMRPSLETPLRSFVRACPIADIDSNADMLLVTFASSINSDGIIITENFRYAGFLSATSLLKIIHEKRLQEAQDQNPLTRLPGNSAISRYIADVAKKSAQDRHLCYLDFDNFKPFNDTYGYRQGDRAIILFSELLQRHISGSGTFHGHIGGDDFFAGFQNADQTDVAARMLALKRAFRDDVESFYEAEHRELGYMEAQDRFGTTRQFPLLQCSISILSLAQGVTLHPDTLNHEISELKLEAKRSDDGIVVKSLAA
ncbi:EAL domain-containing protein [uncultured Roseibium sp.]|uniref:bifunctional diguanylate cyclase/phosphodiesterase n=1 Tax=uncultured Roseibium sp. TaxID=1936171 RepID=UPI0026356626|nr:EAL domain-containing protein [uncultured Roseibium sp.]